MEHLAQQVLAGLATGAIYASVALAVVMIYQAIDHFNFAQGEMAMFSAFIAWQLIDWGANYWVAFFVCIVVSFLGGVAIERIIFAPLRNAPVFTHIVVFIALFQIFNATAGYIWEFTIRTFPSPFPERLPFDTILIGPHDLGMIVITLIMLGLIFLFFRFTPVGLAMRAAAAAPDSARLVGISVGWMLALGWGLAAAIGAVAGMMIAPVVFLEPAMMVGILLYGFAGAVVGGLTSPGGAVVGGFFMGVVEPLAGMAIGSELKLTVALVVIVTILIFKPSGLFGRVVVQRV
jgi:branched-chain amino acid transport system permease protein